MRRLLFIAISVALLVGICAGAASARFAADAPRAERVPAPFRTPVSMPREDASHRGTWGYRSSGDIGQTFDKVSTAPGAVSASVTVTATVLPVVIIVVDGRSGAVELLSTNTEDRDATAVLYLVRTDTLEGDAGRLTAPTWKRARVALAQAGAGTGTIWSR